MTFKLNYVFFLIAERKLILLLKLHKASISHAHKKFTEITNNIKERKTKNHWHAF